MVIFSSLQDKTHFGIVLATMGAVCRKRHVSYFVGTPAKWDSLSRAAEGELWDRVHILSKLGGVFMLVPLGGCMSRLDVEEGDGTSALLFLEKSPKDLSPSNTHSEIKLPSHLLQVFFPTPASMLYLSKIVCYTISLRADTQFSIPSGFSRAKLADF